MSRNLLAKTTGILVGVGFLCAVPEMARAQRTLPVTVQTRNAVQPGSQPKKDALPPNDFVGLNYTDDQKAEVDKIHRETESRKEAVAKDQQLTEDQKNALLLGYTRMEYGRVYRVLSPEQQRQVRQRISARKASDLAAQKKQPPRN